MVIRSLRSASVVRIDDLRSLARRRLPRVLFDYVDGGAEHEVTLRCNRAAFDQVKFRPRYGLAVADCDLTTQVLGVRLSVPLLLAPIGYSSILYPAGEIAAARAASKTGTVYILSTFSGQRLEAVRTGCKGPLWYQLYLVGGRDTAQAAIERAKAAGFAALVITIDSAVPGLRERDNRNGMTELVSRKLLPKLPFFGQLLRRPSWLVHFFLNGGLSKLENILIPGKGALTMYDLGELQLGTSFTWQDLGWIRETWTGPIVVKGIITARDARRAVDEGADALIVSNHGGRQLDGLPASLRVLPEVVEAVGHRTEVLMDGGIQRGSDIIKAICLGARAVLCGRAYAYGLSVFGEEGVNQVLDVFADDMERTLLLLGCKSVAELDSSYITVPAGFVNS